MRNQLADFSIGWVCAVEPERVVASELLDEEYGDDKSPKVNVLYDHNIYTFGRICGHKIVIAGLPRGRYGITSGARVVERMRSTFPTLRFVLLVGIAGGVPSSRHDIRLGDIVVSCPTPGHGGVIQYDFGKAIQGREFEQTAHLPPPSDILLTAVGILQALHKRKGHNISETVNQMLKKNQRLRTTYSRPSTAIDKLYKSDYIHLDQKCDCLNQIQNSEANLHLILRPQRTPSDDDPAVHYGLIGSANRLVKDAILRDAIANKHDVLCFETESAGLMDGPFPCLVIKGISDYADSHKNDDWQGYASATAAAYAKELLAVLPDGGSKASAWHTAKITTVNEYTGSPTLNTQLRVEHLEKPRECLDSPIRTDILANRGALLPVYLGKDNLNVTLCLENIRDAFVSSAGGENQGFQVNICIKLAKQLDQIQASIQDSQTRQTETNHTQQDHQILLDCTSRCTSLGPTEAANGLSKLFSGSASYFFERHGGFHPEQYSLEQIFRDRFVLVGSTESAEHNVRTIEKFLLYAITPRKWQRVHVLVTLEDNDELSKIWPPKASINHRSFTGLPPKSILQLLEDVLRECDFTQRITRLLLPINQSVTGAWRYDHQKIEVDEDQKQFDIRAEFDTLEHFQALKCPTYEESELTTLKRLQFQCFLVTNGRNNYVEHKTRFSYKVNSQEPENGIQVFLKGMVKFQKLSDCSSIPRFEGIVLDDSRTYIKGFLCELVWVDLDKALAFAQTKQYTIPRALRRYWARQLIFGVSEVHAMGECVGRLRVQISQDTDMMFYDFWRSLSYLRNSDGRRPPELRDLQHSEGTQKGDIFQLGLILWRLSEHLSRSRQYFCMMANCTIKPKYRCREAHCNPISLPFSENTDPMLQKIIEQCREEDPEKRPTAECLVKQISGVSFDEEQVSRHKMAFRSTMRDASDHESHTIWCSECWAICMQERFSCDICFDGDFDLCPNCVTSGLHCWNESHQLFRRRVDLAGNLIEEPYTRVRL